MLFLYRLLLVLFDVVVVVQASSTGETKSSSPSSTSTTTTVAATSIRVPEDCKTLKEAVERVHGDDGLTTIVVGKGEHRIDGDSLKIGSAMNIVGDPGCRKVRLWSWVVFRSSTGFQGIAICNT